jgi:WD40 repeat protein
MSVRAVFMMKRKKAEGKAGMATGIYKRRRELMSQGSSSSEVSSRKVMSVAGIITAGNVKTMRKIFARHNNKLDVIQFVGAMKSCLDTHAMHMDDLEFAVQMIELYKQIDINGDGILEWSEFTSFIVGVGKTLNLTHDGIMKRSSSYVSAHATVPETISHDTVDKLLVLGPPANGIAVIYKGSHDVRIYGMPIRPDQHSLKCERTLRHHEQFTPHEVSYAICIPEFDVIATCAADKLNSTTYISFWGCYEKRIPPKLLTRIKTSFPIDIICWCGGVNTLYAAASEHSGYIYGWYVRPILIPRPNNNFEPSVEYMKRCTIHWHSEGITDMFVIAGNVDTMLVSASKDGTMCMWNTRTNIPFYSVVAHDTGIKRAVYFEKLDIVITIAYGSISYPKTLIPLVFDSADDFEQIGKLHHDVYGHQYPLLDIGVQSGLKLEAPHIVSIDERGNIRTWNASTFDLLQAFASQDELFPLDALAHNKTLHAAACLKFEDVEALRADAEEEAKTKRIEADIRSLIIRGLYIPHAVPAILVATKKIRSFEMRPVHAKHESLICAIYNSNSCTFLTCSLSTVQIWDAFEGTVSRQYDNIHLLGSSKIEITSCILDDREGKFIIGDTTGRILVFNYLNGAFMKELNPHDKPISQLIYCKEDKIVISSSGDGRCFISDEFNNAGYILNQRKHVIYRDICIDIHLEPKADGVDISCLAFSYHFNAILTLTRVAMSNADDKRVINLWDFEYAKLEGMYDVYGIPNEIVLHESDRTDENDALYAVTDIIFLQNYPAFIVTDSAGTMCIYTLPTYKKPHGTCAAVMRRSTATSFTEQGSLGILCCSVSAANGDVGGGFYVHAGEENGRVALWHISEEFLNSLNIFKSTEPKRQKSYSGHRSMKDQRFRLYAILSHEATVFPPLSTLKPKRVWVAHRAPLSSLQFIPESKALLVASLDGTASLWSPDGIIRVGIMDTDANKPKPPWRLNIDLCDRKKREEKEAVKVLSEIRKLNEEFKREEIRRMSQLNLLSGIDFKVTQIPKSPFRVAPIHPVKHRIGKLLLDNVGRKVRPLLSPTVSPKNEAGKSQSGRKISNTGKHPLFDSSVEDEGTDLRGESSILSRPQTSHSEAAKEAAVKKTKNKWRHTIASRQKRERQRKGIKSPSRMRSKRNSLQSAGNLSRSLHDELYDYYGGEDNSIANRRLSTAPLPYFDNRTARSTNSDASELMNSLWHTKDGLEQYYGELDDMQEESKILGQYERTSRYNNEHEKSSDANMLMTSSINDAIDDLAKSGDNENGKSREGVSEQIQRIKKSVSRNSLSRLGKRTYQIL